MIDKNKIKTEIAEKLEQMEFPLLFDDELKYAKEILGYLKTCLWIKK